jgi:hypothetical protein
MGYGLWVMVVQVVQAVEIVEIVRSRLKAAPTEKSLSSFL